MKVFYRTYDLTIRTPARSTRLVNIPDFHPDNRRGWCIRVPWGRYHMDMLFIRIIHFHDPTGNREISEGFVYTFQKPNGKLGVSLRKVLTGFLANRILILVPELENTSYFYFRHSLVSLLFIRILTSVNGQIILSYFTYVTLIFIRISTLVTG